MIKSMLQVAKIKQYLGSFLHTFLFLRVIYLMKVSWPVKFNCIHMKRADFKRVYNK